ncbi:MAG TPA: AMP-binding protein, partial [Acidimicrobiales bacterium]|nr:AMP-binding protein [Acidimicrobiales bacterium]
MTATILHRRPGTPPAPEALAAPDIVSAFRTNVATRGDAPALRHWDQGGWRTMSWRDYGAAVAAVAAGLGGLGIRPGDRVAILSGNRVEWHLADLGVISAGAVSVPLYVTASSSQLAYLLRHSGARVCFAEDPGLAAKVLLRRDELPDLEHVVLFGPTGGLDHGLIVPFAQLASADGPTPPMREVAPGDLATIVYTSGTTGPPKGAMITHGNIMSGVRSVTQVVPIGPEDRFISYLPLSHIAERITSHLGQLVSGGETWFARSLATVGDDLVACRPTVFLGVPRVWEKLQEGVLAAVEAQPPPLRHLTGAYLRNAATVAAGGAGVGAGLEHLALDPVIGATIRRKLGLDRARVLVSGAAPAHPPLLSWFAAIGLTIAEEYGQTEDCGLTSMNPLGRVRPGTVGPPLPGVEVRLAPDGEILVRAGHVIPGYFGDDRATARLIDAEGWMHSGDLGTFDADGYLRVIGRVKDLIVTAAGKNVAPGEIENRLRYERLISQAVVAGDGR